MICEQIVDECVSSYRAQIRSICITGSLARDEATFRPEGDCVKLLGDADCFLVGHHEMALPSLLEIASLERRIEARCLKLGVTAKVGVGAIAPDFLRHLPPTIATHELQRCGRVVWGDASVLELVPNFPASGIALEDAWRLLCNRVIEQLEYSCDFSPGSGKLSALLAYSTVKLYLDMATSYLVFLGAYEPTYRERERRLRELASEENSANEFPFSLRAFADRVTWCTNWKLAEQEFGHDRNPEFWQEGIEWARVLWRWEIARMTSLEIGASIPALCERLASQQTAATRLRGWLSLCKRASGYRSWRNWFRWAGLARHGTPRYLIYQAAAELLDRTQRVEASDRAVVSGTDWREVSKLLPCEIPYGNEINGSTSWRILAAQIFWNYRQFLLGTSS